MNDDMQELAQICATDRTRGISERVDREKKLQGRSKRIRTICRWTRVISAILALPCLFFGIKYSTYLMYIGTVFALSMIVSTIVLFFMGGFAEHWAVRLVLSDREKKLLDD